MRVVPRLVLLRPVFLELNIYQEMCDSVTVALGN
jgi:hypothetical protein